MNDLDLAISLVQVAQCPNCDGGGVIVREGTDIDIGCCGDLLPTGECCGLGVPVEVPIQVPEQCQWCAEREELLKRYE